MLNNLSKFILITALAVFNQFDEVNASSPAGSWSASCSNPRVEGNKLTADCKNIAGNTAQSTFDFSNCSPLFIANCNGTLQCGECGTTQAAALPAGSWSASCSNPRVEGNKLTADCKNIAGNTAQSTFDFSNCSPLFIANCNGTLQCGECSN
jgi:ribosomal protein S27AE